LHPRREAATMHFMINVTYPLKVVREVANRFVAAQKDEPLPEYIKRQGIYAEYGGKGMATHHLYEIERGHEDEGLKALVKNYIKYYDIEGFEIEARVVLPAEEALPMLGLSM
jgi:hypothetical protein